MVGVFMMMWLAALMALAASGMQHRQLANRFMAYANDRVKAFDAADRALADARHRLTDGADARAISQASTFQSGPNGVLAAQQRDADWSRTWQSRWQKVDWRRHDIVVRVHRARYFIERIAFGAYEVDGDARSASVRRYRVSAMGCGDLPSTRVYLQAIYEVRRRESLKREGGAPSFALRPLSWREVVSWDDSAIRSSALTARSESCDET
jgi:Tfp pilus assembly protein PilX